MYAREEFTRLVYNKEFPKTIVVLRMMQLTIKVAQKGQTMTNKSIPRVRKLFSQTIYMDMTDPDIVARFFTGVCGIHQMFQG